MNNYTPPSRGYENLKYNRDMQGTINWLMEKLPADLQAIVSSGAKSVDWILEKNHTHIISREEVARGSGDYTPGTGKMVIDTLFSKHPDKEEVQSIIQATEHAGNMIGVLNCIQQVSGIYGWDMEEHRLGWVGHWENGFKGVTDEVIGAYELVRTLLTTPNLSEENTHVLHVLLFHLIHRNKKDPEFRKFKTGYISQGLVLRTDTPANISILRKAVSEGVGLLCDHPTLRQWQDMYEQIRWWHVCENFRRVGRQDAYMESVRSRFDGPSYSAEQEIEAAIARWQYWHAYGGGRHSIGYLDSWFTDMYPEIIAINRRHRGLR